MDALCCYGKTLVRYRNIWVKQSIRRGLVDQSIKDNRSYDFIAVLKRLNSAVRKFILNFKSVSFRKIKFIRVQSFL